MRAYIFCGTIQRMLCNIILRVENNNTIRTYSACIQLVRHNVIILYYKNQLNRPEAIALLRIILYYVYYCYYCYNVSDWRSITAAKYMKTRESNYN